MVKIYNITSNRNVIARMLYNSQNLTNTKFYHHTSYLNYINNLIMDPHLSISSLVSEAEQ
jgi:hypothetical protein